MITEKQGKLIQQYLSNQADALTQLMHKLDIGGYVIEGKIISAENLKNKKVSFEVIDDIRFRLAPTYEIGTRKKEFIRYTQVTWYLLYKMGYTYDAIGAFYKKSRPNVYTTVTKIHHLIKQRDSLTVKVYNEFTEKLQPTSK